MVAYIRRMVVQRRKWISGQEFEEGVALCQAVPGATAMQCSAWVGLRLRRLAGAVAAYLGFGLPAFVLMLALSMTYRHVVDLPVVASTLGGIRVLVVALVANAAWTFARSSIRRPREGTIAAVTAALFFMGGSPVLIIVGAGLVGVILLRGSSPPNSPDSGPRTARKALLLPAVVLGLAVALAAVLLVVDSRLGTMGLLMMKVDLLAFGGGFSSVPLMFHEIVDSRGWLPAGVFLDGIALGQVTPGPIGITATFVGYQLAGVPGAVVGTVCVFLPSILVVVLAEPWFRRFRSSPAFQGATKALVLSFVGLLACVTVQFAQLAPWSIRSGIIGALALVALLLRVDVLWVVLGGAAVSAVVL